MFMLLNNLFFLAVLFLVSLSVFSYCLRKNKLLARTICVFLSLQAILVAFIVSDQHRFTTDISKSNFMDDGESYSSSAWQISTALTGAIPDLQSIAKMRGIHILNRDKSLERYYYERIKEKIIPPADEYGVRHIAYLYSIIYAAYGFKPVFINFMNVLFHLITSVLLYKSAMLIFNRRAAYLSTLFFLFNPISFYYSSTKLLDSIAAFAVYFAIYCFLVTIKKGSFLYAFLIIPSFYIINYLKAFYFIPLVLAFIISSAIVIFKKNKKLFFILSIFIIFCLISMHIDVFGKIKFYTKKLLEDSIFYQKGFYYTGGRVYQLFIPGKDSWQDYTFFDWASYIFKGWYHLLSEPILSSNSSAKLILLFPVKLVFLILCTLAVPGILMAARYGHIEAVIFLSILIIVGTGLAMTSGNIGNMLRHREIITPIIFIFSALYISRFFETSDLITEKGAR